MPKHPPPTFASDHATGYAVLETKRSWKLEALEIRLKRGLGNFHQQPFGLGILDAVHKRLLSCTSRTVLVRVTQD